MKKILIPTILLSFVLFSCSNETTQTPQKYYQTSQTQTGNIIESQSYVWYTDSFHSIALAPKVWGKIISLTKNVWDYVKIWEVIATLDSQEAKTWYTSSNDIIKNLENLKTATSQMFDSQILVMEEKIKQAKTNIEIANIGAKWNESWVLETKDITKNQLTTIESQIQTAQTSVESALLQLENTKNSLFQKENDIYSNSKSALTNANILASNIIDFLDNIFWVSQANKHKNDPFEIYLWARNITLKNEVEQNLEKFIHDFKEIQKLSWENQQEVKEVLETYHNIFWNDMRKLLKNAYTVFENTVENTYLSQSTIQEYKSQITKLQTQNEQIILSVSGNYFLWLKWSLDSIKSFDTEKKSTIDMLEKQLELAKKQKETLENSKNQISSTGNAQITDITTKNEIAKKQKELSENAFQEALAWLESLKKQKQASLTEIDAQIWQVQSGKNEAWVMIENGKVTSLIDGIVTKKLVEIGSVIWAGTPIIMVSNDKNIKIEIALRDDSINTIHIWDEVQAEIEWVSELVSGNISNIFPSKDTLTKKTTVEIKIDNPKVKIGSYAKVYLNTNTNSQTTAILIPNQAIISKYMLPQVFVLENGKAKLTHIKIIKQNDSFSQIEWLSAGQIVITDGKENIYDNEELVLKNE